MKKSRQEPNKLYLLLIILQFLFCFQGNSIKNHTPHKNLQNNQPAFEKKWIKNPKFSILDQRKHTPEFLNNNRQLQSKIPKNIHFRKNSLQI